MATTQILVGGVPQFTLKAAGDVAAVDVGDNQTAGLVISGTWTGSLSLLATVDGSRFDAVSGLPIPSGPGTSTITGNGVFAVPVGGFAQFRVALAANPAPTGSPVVSIKMSPGAPSAIFTEGVIFPPAVCMETPDTGTSGAGADLTLTFAAVQGQQHCLDGVAWSYSAAPTGGRLTIADGSLVCLDLDITAAGPGSMAFPVPRGGTPGNTLVVKLFGGGGAVVGKLNLLGHYMVGGSGSFSYQLNFGQPVESFNVPVLF